MVESGIYVIRNTATGKVYVGSAVSFAKRWREHSWDLGRKTHGNQLLQRAWDKYGANGFVFEILERVEDLPQLVVRESHWIQELEAACRDKGYNLCPTAGSMLGFKFSLESRQKMSDARRGNKKSAEHQAKITAALKGRQMSAAHRAALSKARTGARATEEQKTVLRAAQKTRVISPEARERMVSANIGRKFTSEHRKRISRALKGKTLSEAHKEKLRVASLNRLYAGSCFDPPQ